MKVHDKASCSAIRSATRRDPRTSPRRRRIFTGPILYFGLPLISAAGRHNGTCLVAVENREDGAMLAAAARYAWKANGASCASAMPTMLANARKEKPSARPRSPNDILLRPTIV